MKTLTERLSEYKPNDILEPTPEYIKNFVKTSTSTAPNQKSNIVNIYHLTTDAAYARNPSKELPDDFNPEIMPPITLSYRDDKLYVIDGQRRILTAAKQHILYLPCIIFTNLTQKDEAKIMVLSHMPESLTPYEKFQANLIQEYPPAMKIKEVCEKYNLDPFSKKFAICGANNIMRLYPDGTALDWVCDILTQRPNLLQEENNYPVFYGLQSVYLEGCNKNCLDTYRTNILTDCKECSANELLAYGKPWTKSSDKRNIIKAALLIIARQKWAKFDD